MAYVLWSCLLYEAAGAVCQQGRGRPPLRPLRCVGTQSLAVFLLANLMTGGVRLALAPEAAPARHALLALALYLAALVLVAMWLGPTARKWW